MLVKGKGKLEARRETRNGLWESLTWTPFYGERSCKGRYTLGDELQQHVAATRCSDKSLRVNWRNLWKSLSLQQNFVAATSRTDSVWFDFLRLVAATKFCCGDKDFHKNSPVHTKRFVAATCRFTLLLQLVARPVHMEWYVAATCCCNLSPSVYRPLDRTEAWRAE